MFYSFASSLSKYLTRRLSASESRSVPTTTQKVSIPEEDVPPHTFSKFTTQTLDAGTHEDPFQSDEDSKTREEISAMMKDLGEEVASEIPAKVRNLDSPPPPSSAEEIEKIGRRLREYQASV